MEGFSGTTYKDKIRTFFEGSVPLHLPSYALTPESSNFDGVVGPYFHLGVGTAMSSGRNYSNDPFQTYVITADPEMQGAFKYMTVVVAGRGIDGNEGQQFFRASGGDAKILGTSTKIIFEPVDAMAESDYSIVDDQNWTFYKLSVFPGSRIILVQPHNTGAFVSAASAIAATHIYDTAPFNSFDRWKPTIFVGYMALKGTMNLREDWISNVGSYAFYDRNKVEIL
jgi:hypothetical protein